MFDPLFKPLSVAKREFIIKDLKLFFRDTTQWSQSNAGHTFGDHLTSDERRAVIEYLKTL